MATIAGEFGRASNVNVHSFALGAKLSRNNIRTKLAGEGLECILNGLYLTRDEQLADHHMIVEHAAAPLRQPRIFQRHPGRQIQRRFSRAHLRPSYRPENRRQADEQKSPALRRRHRGYQTAIGNLCGRRQMHPRGDHWPVEQRKYFLSACPRHSRGAARRMLIHAFAGEIVERVKCAPVREELDKLVWDRLEASHHLSIICAGTFCRSTARPYMRPVRKLKVCLTTLMTFISRSSWTTARSRAISTKWRRPAARPRAAIPCAAISSSFFSCSTAKNLGHQLRRLGLLHFQGVRVLAHRICQGQNQIRRGNYVRPGP